MSARVLIVGAGPNGLAAARACRTFGVEYDHVERHTDVGGIWDHENDGSPIYESAHFISSKSMSGFLGFPMPESFPDYPSRSQILSYLRDFADAFALREGIQFGTAVTSAAERAGGGWNVTLGDKTTRTYDALIACTGTQWLPVMPTYPGTFTGDMRHSSTYWSGDELRKKRVLIIGGGNSGFDIACDAAKSASEASLSLRRGYWVIPKHIFGQPSDMFADSGPHVRTGLPSRSWESCCGWSPENKSGSVCPNRITRSWLPIRFSTPRSSISSATETSQSAKT